MLAFDSVFHAIALVLVVCAALGAVAMRLRQPLIVSFIAAGILVGPGALGVIEEPQEIELLATIGISLLLFVVGLKLDLRLVRTLGPVALATGLGQVAFTSAIGFGIALALGLELVPAVYVAVALTFSSTIIIVKLLSDKRETEDLHGRIAIGLLIVQDLVVVIAMIALTAIGQAGDRPVATEVGFVALRGAGFLLALGLLMRWVLPPLMHRLAHLPEMLTLFGIAWAVALAALGDLLGFSVEVGAFLAGVSLASTPYREALSGRLVSLRDFLLLFFFIDLGSRLDLAEVGTLLGPAVVLSLFVLVGNPIIVMAIMGAMGYRKRVSFLTGLTVAQISEFSLILAALGMQLGHIGGETVGLVTAVGLITIGTSTYLIYNSQAIYERIAPALSVFERAQPTRGPAPEEGERPEVVVMGLGRLGSALLEELVEEGRDVLGVDFDPQALRQWSERGVAVMYGDVEDPELASSIPLEEVDWVLVATRREEANLAVLQTLYGHGYQGRVAVSANTHAEAQVLHEAGADYVMLPFVDTAEVAVRALEWTEENA